MQASAQFVAAPEFLSLRTKFRAEMNAQITKDSIHDRDGWSQTYRPELGGRPAGFGGMAVAGPWQDRPTIFEFHVLPESARLRGETELITSRFPAAAERVGFLAVAVMPTMMRGGSNFGEVVGRREWSDRLRS